MPTPGSALLASDGSASQKILRTKRIRSPYHSSSSTECNIVADVRHVEPGQMGRLVRIPDSLDSGEPPSTWVLASPVPSTSTSPMSVSRYSDSVTGNRGRPALKLGQTTFAALESIMQTTPEGLAGCLGARRVAYAEACYFVNPGGYARYVVAFNDAGVRAEAVAFPKVSSAAPGRPAFRIGSFFRQGAQDFGTVREDPTLVAWRRVQIINTYAMLDPTVELQAALASGFGPDLDRVRFLPSPTGWPAASAPH